MLLFLFVGYVICPTSFIILERLPQPLHKDIAKHVPFRIHSDRDPDIFQKVRKVLVADVLDRNLAR